MSDFPRGFLRQPAVTRFLDRCEADEEARAIRERNEAVYTRAIEAWFRRTDQKATS